MPKVLVAEDEPNLAHTNCSSANGIVKRLSNTEAQTRFVGRPHSDPMSLSSVS